MITYKTKEMKQRKLIYRGRTRKTGVKQRINGTSREVVQFPITDDQLQRIQRTVIKPRDCVINAMEIIGIVDGRSADIMRIMVGDTGIITSNIEGIFEFAFRRTFTFTPDNRIDLLGNYLDTSLMINHVVFLGVVYDDGNSHVFLIGKTMTNSLVYIDPQNPSLCNLRDPACFTSVFARVTSYSILQMETTSPLILLQETTEMADAPVLI